MEVAGTRDSWSRQLLAVFAAIQLAAIKSHPEVGVS
jgi:hypothetical protein